MNFIYQNKEIYYNICGNGKALVFLHGFTENSEIWNDFSSFLSNYYTCITIDLPGHGKSDTLENEHSMEEMAFIVKNIIDSNKINNCIIVGHSMGGYVALAFAEAYPELLKGLCLFHSSALDDTIEIKQNRERTIDFVRKDKFSFLNQFIPDLFAPENKSKYQNDIDKLLKNAELMTPEGIINAISGMKNRKTRVETLMRLNIPVLFIAGKKDSRVPIDKIIQQISLPKHSESLILDNVGHMGYIEAKDLTLETITYFAKKIYR